MVLVKIPTKIPPDIPLESIGPCSSLNISPGIFPEILSEIPLGIFPGPSSEISQ